MKTYLPWALLPLAILAGCGSTPDPMPAPAAPAAIAPRLSPPPAPQCDATGAQFAVGQPATPQLEIAAGHRASASTVRSLKPGQATTMEFNESRLSLILDAKGRVTAVRCG